MKIVLVLWVLLGGLAARGVDLGSATNGQILQELERRLNGGVGSVTQSLATYLCDSSAYLSLDFFGPTGTSQQFSKYVGTQAHCQEQQKVLSQHKSKIFALSLIALCDSSGYLYRLPLTPQGAIGEVTQKYVGSYQNCISQATAINMGK